MMDENLKRSTINEKESPDVETPGLLVKALISSYFKKVVLCQALCKYNGLHPIMQETSLPFSWYFY
jgi:hypothetical protein